MHFAELPAARAVAAPGAPSLTDDILGTLTNADFAARVARFAAGLSERGVGPGDVVAVRLPNRTDLVVTLFAAWRIGAAATPVNPALTFAEAEYQVQDSGAKVLVSFDDAAIDGSVTVTPEQLAGSTGDATSVPYAVIDLALIVYTSGTTGRPKGVELTQSNLSAMTDAMIEGMALIEADHSLLILPLFHVNGIVVSILSPLRAGGQSTIVGRFTPQDFIEALATARPTYFSAVPAIYAMLVNLPAVITLETSSLRFVACGAAPMPAALIGQVEERFGVIVMEGYGLSEATCASTSNPLDGVRKHGTVGIALPGQTVAIMGPDGTLLPPGERGEVVIQGPTVMRGYLNRPGATAETLVDGWLHTGDVGVFDEDGYLSIVDRVKDMIIRGGENIYPKEIEQAIHSHPAVLETAVVGQPDAVMGEVPVAFVSLKADQELTAEELLGHLQDRLAKFKTPSEFIFVPEIPKNPIGKIDKPRLRRELAPQSA